MGETWTRDPGDLLVTDVMLPRSDEQRELYVSAAGPVLRKEVQGVDENSESWIIWDLDGKVLGSVEDHGGQGWKHLSLPVGLPGRSFTSFEDALTDRLSQILASDGVQSDDLYWEGEGLPRLRHPERAGFSDGSAGQLHGGHMNGAT